MNTNENTEVVVGIKTQGTWNPRRYSKPYVGLLSFTEEGKMSVTRWGNFVGETGGEGACFIKVNVGDIIIHGQKDNRSNGGFIQYFQVMEDGKLDELKDKKECYERFTK